MRNSHDFTNSDYSGPASFCPEPHSGKAITAEQAWLLFPESDGENESQKNTRKTIQFTERDRSRVLKSGVTANS